MTHDEAIEEIKKWLNGCPYEETVWAFELAIEKLKEQRPTVSFRYKGKNIADIDLYSCMGCGETMYFCNDEVPKYCPYCGAKGEVNYGL